MESLFYAPTYTPQNNSDVYVFSPSFEITPKPSLSPHNLDRALTPHLQHLYLDIAVWVTFAECTH